MIAGRGERRRLSTYCAAVDIPSSSIVEAALRQCLDGTSDEARLLRSFARLGRAAARTQPDLELLSEAFAAWAKVWFAHAPRIDDGAMELARRTAESRHARFVEQVAERLSGGERFLDDLPREMLADEVELEKIAAQTSALRGPAEPAGEADAE